jgi:hypothetical protein
MRKRDGYFVNFCTLTPFSGYFVNFCTLTPFSIFQITPSLDFNAASDPIFQS